MTLSRTASADTTAGALLESSSSSTFLASDTSPREFTTVLTNFPEAKSFSVVWVHPAGVTAGAAEANKTTTKTMQLLIMRFLYLLTGVSLRCLVTSKPARADPVRT